MDSFRWARWQSPMAESLLRRSRKWRRRWRGISHFLLLSKYEGRRKAARFVCSIFCDRDVVPGLRRGCGRAKPVRATAPAFPTLSPTNWLGRREAPSGQFAQDLFWSSSSIRNKGSSLQRLQEIDQILFLLRG